MELTFLIVFEFFFLLMPQTDLLPVQKADNAIVVIFTKKDSYW